MIQPKRSRRVWLIHRSARSTWPPAERVYSRPASRFSATFMGESMIFSGHVAGRDRIETVFGEWHLPTPAVVGTEITLAIRPEHVVLGDHPLSLGRAAIADVVFQGSFKRVSAKPERDAALTLLARLTADSVVQPGDVLDFACDPKHVLVLTR
jgi:spermidine/putrescine transport system ATP-binding protein